ncbi:MAG: hypothetical protein ACFFDU_06335 [Candidatus Thorarchaeota archaeon]
MIQSDTIRQAIRTKLTAGTTLKTVGGAEFVVDSVTPVEMVLRVGKQKVRVAIHLNAIEDLVKEFKFLPPNGWMKIGATTGQPSSGTLGAVVKAHTQGPSSASQFAAVLAHVNVAEINPRRPSRIRLLV